MNEYFSTGAATCLTIGLTSLAVNHYATSLAHKIEQKAANYRIRNRGIGSEDFRDRGDWFSFFGGSMFFIGYLMSCVWVYVETKDAVLTLLPVLMFGWFGVFGAYGIVTPFLRKIEFLKNEIIYDEILSKRVKISRDDINSVTLRTGCIMVVTKSGRYSISAGFRKTHKIYAKLKEWNA